MILALARRSALLDKGEHIVQHYSRSACNFLMEGQSRVIIADGDAFLADNITIIRLRSHIVQRNTGLLLSMDQYPVNRTSAPIFWKKGTMQIKATSRRDIQDCRLNQMAIIEREDNIGLHLPDYLHPKRMIDILRCVDRNISAGRPFRYRVKPDILTRIILMRKDGGYFKAVSQQGFNANASNIVISTYYRFHIINSDSVSFWIALTAGMSLLPTTSCTK